MAGSAQSNTISYSGTFTDTPSYHRPSYTNPYTPAFNCSSCGFQSEKISVSASGAYTFAIVSDNFPDQVGELYSGSFNPASPMANFVGPYSHATYLSGNASTVSLFSGIDYYWVTSTDFGYTHDHCAAGCTFTTSVTGLGTISAGVPEPSIWATMLLGFGLMGATLRSGRRTITAQA